MDNWQYHDNKMRKLKKVYNRISKQTQNELQNIFDSYKIDFKHLYNVADNKTLNRIKTKIEELKDKGLLNGYFGMLANNIYKRTRVKNNEILELLIYGAYIEEQSKLEETELNIFKDVANYYYQQGQEEVNQTLPKKKRKLVSVIPDAIFLALLDMQNEKGYVWKQYVEAIIKYNADQIYRQMLINIQQNKENDIDDSVYQNIITKQQNAKLSINQDKISGAVDNELIGLNNLAKVEGIKSIAEDDNSQVKLWAVTDENSTDMCQSMNGMKFYINKENSFDRYWGETKKDLRIERIRCFGLVVGLNLPPISHHFHYCRSTITYQVPVEKEEKTEYNKVDYIRKNKYTNSKNLDTNIKKALKLLSNNIKELIKDTKIEISSTNSYYDRKNNTIHLLRDSNKYEILHEIGHATETRLNILHDNKYINIQRKGLENINPITDINKIRGYGENDFVIDTGKFISEYQRRIYENDIDGNSLLNYNNFTFNTKTLGEYFSEGFRCYFENNNLLKRKDKDLYDYIKEILR